MRTRFQGLRVATFPPPGAGRVLIEMLKPNVLVKGGDWPEEKIIGAPEVKRSGGRVLTIPLEPASSTSAVIKKIRST